MRLPRKWFLSVGLLAAAPGITLAGPFDFLRPTGAQETAPTDAPRSNQEIANDVAAALREARISGKIEIVVSRGACTIKGEIADARLKARISQLAAGVEGVEIVDNQLAVLQAADAAERAAPASPVQQAGFEGANGSQIQQVSHSGGNQRIAEQIADAVAGAGLRHYDIEIRYKDGACSLVGDVRSREEAAIAIQAAQGISGVEYVLTDGLTVNGQPFAPPQPRMQQPQMQPQQPHWPAAFGQQPAQPGQPALTPQQQQQMRMYLASQAAAAPGAAGPAVAAAGAAPLQQAGHLIHNRPTVPEYAWPSYAAYDNYAQVTYPSAYDASAWPYIGPFYPYPQVPLGWRKAQLEWDDGHWQLKFNARTDKWWWFLDPSNWDE